MTLNEAMAMHGPSWLQIWMPFLGAGGLLAPALLLIWKQSRMTGIIGIIAFVLGMIGVGFIYSQLGYVKLLGLPHVILWTPFAFLLWRGIRDESMPVWPVRIMMFSLVIIVISLAFDYADVIRYILGERTPLAMPLPAS